MKCKNFNDKQINSFYNLQDNQGNTIYHYACRGWNKEIIQTFIRNRAAYKVDIAIKNCDGNYGSSCMPKMSKHRDRMYKKLVANLEKSSKSAQ